MIQYGYIDIFWRFLMKKLISIFLFLSSCITLLAGCTPSEESSADVSENSIEANVSQDVGDVSEPENDEPKLDLDSTTALDVTKLTINDTYTIGGGDTLSSYFEEPLESFFGTCKYYSENEWTLYNYNEINKNHFATYYKGDELRHIYWIECESELNIVTSTTGGGALPPIEPEKLPDEQTPIATSVTQIQSPEVNGMGYVIQLADGSFIIQDGGYASRANELWNTLVELNGGKENIVIRAWILTHGHDDHYPCFSAFGNNYGSKVTLETVMISPLSDEDAKTLPNLNKNILTDIQKFEGAKLLYVHTGMVFNYCNVKLEILYTADELWIAEPTRDECLEEIMNYNNSSIISRIKTDDYSAIFLGDASEEAALRLVLYYGKYLKSDMCQVAHHGVEDFPLIAYRFINASILWVPCNQYLFDLVGRDDDVRKALANSKYTEEVILHDASRETREFK